MSKSHGDVIVVKIGGATLGSHDTTIEDAVALQKQGKSLIIVHGGGKLITEWLNKQGHSSRFVHGERVTDGVTLEVAVAVLAGLVNKEIVAAINGGGGQAVGISGVDGSVIQAEVKNVELGYVGAVARVEVALLKALTGAGFIPVIAPVSLYAFGRPQEAPWVVNVNADVVAGEIAAAIGAERLIFLTDVDGVSDRAGKLLSSMSPDEARALIESGVASGGMIPKINACLKALSGRATACIIDGRQPHALLHEVEGRGGGTRIENVK